MACAAVLFPLAAHAQARGAVQGTVVDSASGRPIPSVQMTVSGTSLGTLTSADGSYSIDGIPAGERTIRARRIGYGTRDVAVNVSAGGVATADFRLSSSASQLDAVVVTALGIEQQKRAVTNSVQELEGAELTKSGATNLVDALSGNASGVTITNSGTEGGSSRIVIRGASSLTGNNQPLFVIDGIPVNNSSSDGDGYGAIDYGNAISWTAMAAASRTTAMRAEGRAWMPDSASRSGSATASPRRG